VEALYLDAIAAARRSIYIGAQYFISTAIAEAIEKRLMEPAGPEALLILPRDGAGWLEQHTMTVLRTRLLRRLRAADRTGSLRVYYPAAPNIHQCVGLDGRRDVARIARVLDGLDAQLIGLQEVGTDSACGGRSSQMEYLARATGLQAIAGPTIEQKTSPYGNVLLTGGHVLSSRLLDLSVPGREPRGAIDADLLIEGRPVRVIVTHLGLRAAERRYQVRRLLEALSRGQNRFIIVLGDINEWVLRSRPLRWLYERFGKPPAPRTFPS
jgi:endonuclease/exonuclease/phosphatase family metal-dependent hydrolase